MSLSVYNLKSYAFSDPEIRRQWNIHIIQSPLINVMQQNVEVPKLVEQIIAKKPQIVGFSCYMWNLAISCAMERTNMGILNSQIRAVYLRRYE